MIAALIIAGLSVAYRIRGHRPEGGWLRVIMHPVFTLRPLWAASVFLAVYTLSGDLWVSAAVALGEWVGLHLRHAPGQDMGTWAGTVRDDVGYMAMVGTQRGGIVAVMLAGAYLAGCVSSFPLAWTAIPVLYAVALPLSYWLGWRIPWRVPGILRGGLEWSELLTGATRGAVLVMVFGAA